MARHAKNGLWPAPVYVATFADGEVARWSFHSRAGKPIDFAAGRRGVCHAWRKGGLPGYVRAGKLGWPTQMRNADGTRWTPAQSVAAPARTDLVDGHVEHAGATYADPMFAPAPLVITAPIAGRAKPLARSVLLRDLYAALAALASVNEVFGEAFPDELTTARAVLAQHATHTEG